MNPANCLSHIFKWLTIKCVQQAMITLQGMGFKARVLFFNEKEQWIQSMLYLNNTYNTLWNTFTILRLIWVRKFYLIVEKWHACSQLQKSNCIFVIGDATLEIFQSFSFLFNHFEPKRQQPQRCHQHLSLSLSLSLFLCLSKTQSARNQSFFSKLKHYWIFDHLSRFYQIRKYHLSVSICLSVFNPTVIGILFYTYWSFSLLCLSFNNN